MGQGLGKNSAVVLSLGRENYEALIERHGQRVRWRVAHKCPCSDTRNGQPDIHCPRCAGLGVVYSLQPSYEYIMTALVQDATGIVELPLDATDARLVSARDKNSAPLVASKKGRYLVLDDAALPDKAEYITVRLEDKCVQRIDEVLPCVLRAKTERGAYYTVEMLQSERSTIEGVDYTSPCDIVAIDVITDCTGERIEYSACEFRLNGFYLEASRDDDGNPIELPDYLYVHGVEYVRPYTFALINQNISDADKTLIDRLAGDALLIFPYCYNVAQDDVITVLTGSYTKKSVLTKQEKEDILPAYFVDRVDYLASDAREYEQNKDFFLVGTNRIVWVADDAPNAGEAISVSYAVFPTYKVIQAVPQVRTSENQRLPKKAVVKLYDTYGEARGVNRQGGKA